MKQSALFVLSLLIAAPLAAQNQDLGQPVLEGGEVETIDEGEGLSGTVSFDGNLDDLGIAIPGFATDRDVATPASSSGTAALGKELARVITADLRNNGLFKPTGPDSLPTPSYAEITAPAWATWDNRRAEMLVHGYVRGRSDGSGRAPSESRTGRRLRRGRSGTQTRRRGGRPGRPSRGSALRGTRSPAFRRRPCR